MSQININIRMEEDLKSQFDALCKDMGMSMTTAMNIFARKMVRERKIPFEINGNIPNTETIEAFNEMEDMIKNGTGEVFNSVEELFEDLNS